MTIAEWLRQSEDQLQDAGISTARLDSLVLLADELTRDKGWLLSHSDDTLQGSEIKNLNTKIVQRTQHIPLAYIRGHAEFYGREFRVNAHTLVPRPETESLIELLKRLKPALGTRILDIGTGSGCIAITAALELPSITVRACDIDDQALQTAGQNAEQLEANVVLYHADLLAGAEPCDIIVANLPYVPDNFQINTAATHEPRHALFGGDDGLDLYRSMFEQVSTNNWQPQYILTESLPPQHETLADIAKVAGYRLHETDDFIQCFSKV